MPKRKRSGEVSEDDAREAWKAIIRLNSAYLFWEKRATLLPYLGIGAAGFRPPVDLRYVGTEDVYQLSLRSSVPKLVIYGPRGFGKSSDLRALLCLRYQEICVRGRPDRLVGIWNMAACLDDVVTGVRNALLFTYLMPSKKAAEEALKEESKEAAEELQAELDRLDVVAVECSEVTLSEALEEIRQVGSVADAIKFVRRRKEEYKEVFRFFVDGWELEPETKKRVEVQNVLSRLFAEGEQVWYCASAKSNMVLKQRRNDVEFYVKVKPFNNDQYETFCGSSILRDLMNVRRDDIVEYTGLVPMFLDVLCECCERLQTEMASEEKAKLRRLAFVLDVVSVQALQKAVEVRKVDDKELVTLLQEDDECWERLLKLFREHRDQVLAPEITASPDTVFITSPGSI